ncbi:MAG TPA: molybdopterin-dependent oxidoreductase [Candidatus Acidoferrales bacterium]|nr:molybdopterin-dependent oxidoreductase [Candidatus Acidoferrales bacterium]
MPLLLIPPRGMNPHRRAPRIWARLALLLLPACALAPGLAAQTPAGSAQITISGDVSSPLTISADDLKKMPRQTLKVMNPHDKKMEAYEGVPLADLLKRAGVPQGEAVRGPLLASYILVEAEDGYRVVFSLAELDAGFLDSDVLLADTMDGAPLPTGQGPFKLVAPHEKRPARWVRMVKSVTVVKVPSK